MRKISTLLYLTFCLSVFAQEAPVIRGKITDAKTGEHMHAVNIIADNRGGTISDSNGEYSLVVSTGDHLISFYFIGYEKWSEKISAVEGEIIDLDIRMKLSSQMLDEVVVTAGRYEQKLSEVTVSMEVLKRQQISNRNITSLDMILDKTSGIAILDGQPSIRGGGGYSYGAGSRVLMLVDDMPMISGDAGDIKWNYLPVENINQVEVIKGASSVLYGSSALNGVVHLRNRFPGNDPETEITVFSGLYMKPERREMVWWDKVPLFGGATLSHLRKVGNLDIMLSGNYFKDTGYRENESEQRGRGSLNMRYRFKKAKGLSAGFSSSLMSLRASDFLLWQDADSGAYRQNQETVAPYTGLRYNVDPYIEYLTDNGGKHLLKTRIFTVGNINLDTTKSSYSRTLYGDYRYQKTFSNGSVWSNGVSVTSSKILANFFEDHLSSNYAIYSQLDARISQRVKLSAGLRWETNVLDGEVFNARPVVRSGVNYQAGKATFLRGSFGQGYRFPSLAEKFASARVGGIRIFKNIDVLPEQGWSAEIGIKQGIEVGRLRGIADLSLFWTQYSEMIEYVFGVHPPDSITIPTFDHVGFKALNNGNARITGAELTFTGEAVWESLILRVVSGYTFMQPIDLDKLEVEDLQPDDYILNYRFKHAVKTDFELELKHLLLGSNLSYNSRMVNVDEVFVDPVFGDLFLPGYPDYRESNPSSRMLVDLRIGWKINDVLRINLVARNLFNKEYIGRPGDIGPPRNITCQLKLQL